MYDENKMSIYDVKYLKAKMMAEGRIDASHKFAPIVSDIDYAIMSDINGFLTYNILRWPHTEHHFLTRTFCSALRLSEEDCVFWLLKYGETLPNWLEQIEEHTNA